MTSKSRRAAGLLLSLIWTLPFSVSAEDRGEPGRERDLIDSAREHFAESRFQEALNDFQEVDRSTGGRSVEALLGMGNSYLQLMISDQVLDSDPKLVKGWVDGSIQSAQAALDLDPGSSERAAALTLLGESLYMTSTWNLLGYSGASRDLARVLGRRGVNRKGLRQAEAALSEVIETVGDEAQYAIWRRVWIRAELETNVRKLPLFSFHSWQLETGKRALEEAGLGGYAANLISDKTSLHLPRALSREPIPEIPAMVSITQERNLRVSGGEEISVPVHPEDVLSFATDVVARNPSRAFVIKADRMVPYQVVDSVIDALIRAKVERLWLLTDEEPQQISPSSLPTALPGGLPYHKTVPISSLEEPHRDKPGQRAGQDIQAPKKIKDVAPIYPDDAREAWMEGVVILEAFIDREGKVSDVRVLRSIPLLDQAAIDAVRQWRYESFLDDGEPAPFVMNVSVDFDIPVIGEAEFEQGNHYLFEEEDASKALDAYHEVPNNSPYWVTAQRYIGHDIYGIKLGQWRQAVRFLEAAHRAAPDDAVTIEHLGKAYLNSGKADEGTRLLKKVRVIVQAGYKALEDGLLSPAEPSPYSEGLEYGIIRCCNAYRSYDLPAAIPRLCRDACLRESRCKAFEYVTPGMQGKSARCWLHTDVGTPQPDESRVSGIK